MRVHKYLFRFNLYIIIYNIHALFKVDHMYMLPPGGQWLEINFILFYSIFKLSLWIMFHFFFFIDNSESYYGITINAWDNGLGWPNINIERSDYWVFHWLQKPLTRIN